MTVSKRLYYKIGEACKLLDIQPYVLRYWETEFPLLAPTKSKSGQRVYSEAELAVIKRIKELLYDEGFTIAGAKKRLEAELSSASLPAENAPLVSQPETPLPEVESLSEPPDLDTRSAQKIETLREGIGEALRQAHQILDALGPAFSR